MIKWKKTNDFSVQLVCPAKECFWVSGVMEKISAVNDLSFHWKEKHKNFLPKKVKSRTGKSGMLEMNYCKACGVLFEYERYTGRLRQYCDEHQRIRGLSGASG